MDFAPTGLRGLSITRFDSRPECRGLFDAALAAAKTAAKVVTPQISTDVTNLSEERAPPINGAAAAADNLTRELMARRVATLLEDKNVVPKSKMKIERPRFAAKSVVVKAKPVTAPPPELLAIEAGDEPGLANLPEVSVGSFRKTIDADKLPSFAVIDPNYSMGQQGRYQGGARTGMFNPRGFEAGEAPQAPDFGEGDSGVGTGNRLGTGPELQNPDYASDTTGDLDDLVSVAMKVYPQPDGSGYYRVDITPNVRSQRLRSVQKDVVFLIDCSTSISVSKPGANDS